jgi:putative spermidine/putrescine transport system ATP-binding protein
MDAPFLTIRNVHKAFGSVTVVKDFTLDVTRGEFVSFLGPSGCGKTTMLRIVAGFEEPTSGRIVIGGTDVTNLKPNQRNIGMVFQAYALFPNLTVRQNIAFGLKVAGMSRREADARVDEMMSIIKLPEFGDRYPFQLSGGQQQRVALARALAVSPQVLLLDEPLSALDAKIRVSLRDEIRTIQKKLGITTIFVTHDQEEALSMSDRIVVMNEGRAEQTGTPFETYNRPATSFVANFIGTLNVLKANVVEAQQGSVSIGGKTFKVDRDLAPRRKGDPVSLALRPEAVSLSRMPHHDANIAGTISDVHFLGSVIRIYAKLGDNTVSLDMFNNPENPPPRSGEKIEISFSTQNLLVLQD